MRTVHLCTFVFRYLIAGLLVVGLSSLAHPCHAQPGEDSDSSRATPMAERADLGLVIGGKVGGGLGTGAVTGTPVFGLELGYALPPLDRAIELFVAGEYSQPRTDGTRTESDPRLPGDGSFGYDITQQMATVTLGALYRIPANNDWVMPYAGAGGRVYMLNTKVKGDSDGQPFGLNEETQTDFGFVVMGGIDVFLGPGALLAELSYGWAPVDGFVLRNTNVGALSFAAGYRLAL